MSEYSELLHDPRWQEKREEILERDNYECQKCGGCDSELHVHHRWYNNWTDPWDYPDHCYITLCSECHEEMHGI